MKSPRKYYTNFSELPWPLFVRPLPGESFQSWLIRNIYKHEIKVHNFFTKELYPHSPQRDYDRFTSHSLIEHLSFKTDTPFQDILDLTSQRWAPFFPLENFKTSYIWILPMIIRSRKRLGNWTTVCPHCISTEIPYFRLLWRTSFLWICPQCKSYLIDRCPTCDSNVNFYRYDLGNKYNIDSRDFQSCYHCKMPYKMHAIKAEDKAFAQQKKFLFSTNDSIKLQISYPHLYYDGLGILCSFLTSRIKRIQPFKKLLGYYVKEPELVTIQTKQFNSLALSERTVILRTVAKLLDNWPDLLIKTAKESQTGYAYLVGKWPQHKIPFWVFSPLRYLL